MVSINLPLKKSSLNLSSFVKTISPAWNLLNEEWNSLGTWIKGGTGTSEINPIGQLHQLSNVPGSVNRYKTLSNGLSNKYTVKMRLKVDNFAYGLGHADFIFRNGIHSLNLDIFNNEIKLLQQGGWSSHSLETLEDTWYIWKLVMDSDTDTVTIYRDDVEIKTFNTIDQELTGDGYVYTGISRPNGELHIDYIKIATTGFETSVGLSKNIKLSKKSIDLALDESSI